MINIKNLNIKNKKVLIRVDYNVPIENGKVINDFRIRSSFKTINYCLSQNSSIILMSHLGRPSNKEKIYSLEPLIDCLEEYFNTFIHFSKDCISDEAIKISKELLPGEIHLLENLRYYKEEIEDDIIFAKKLSKHGDVYVCDSFGTSHRQHASNSSILSCFKYKGIGFLMIKEFKYLQNNLDFNNLTVIVGGAKISSKLKMINHYIDKCNNIVIGGAMAFTIFKSMNLEVGSSLIENKMINESRNIIKRLNESNTNLLLPEDIVCKNDTTNKIVVRKFNDIKNNDIGLDIGPETMIKYSDCINDSNCIIWNGPMGMFEDLCFATGTHTLTQSISETDEDTITIIGGGDTVTAIEMTHSLSSFTHVSTGGGASLKLLSGEKLDFENSWSIYE